MEKKIPAGVLAYDEIFAREHLVNHLSWCGHCVQKTPSDMWIYQEIVTETRPDLIVEIGSGHGGTALFFAHVMESLAIPQGRVVSYDTRAREGRPEHSRLRFVTGDPRKPENADSIRKAVEIDGRRLMVVEDADHSYSVTSNCLTMFSPLVGDGCYYVVEDAGLGRRNEKVWDAIQDFLEVNPAWMVDWKREKFRHTTCHGGFLRRRNG